MRKEDCPLLNEYKVWRGFARVVEDRTVRSGTGTGYNTILRHGIFHRVVIQNTANFSRLVVILLDRNRHRDEILRQ